jgi:hypothetical protein
MRTLLLIAAAAGNAACSQHGAPLAADAGVDAPVPVDAAIDAVAPPDAPSPYTISIGAPDVVADALISRAVTITGNPGDHVQLAIVRPTMGAPTGSLTPTMVQLDGTGNATASYMPCTDVTADCVGPATLTLALASAPDVIVAHDAIMLDTPADVGEVAPCMTTGNVLYLHGNDDIENGILQTGSAVSWTAVTTPDQVEFDFSVFPGRAVFSLVDMAAPLVPGVYSHAQRADFAQTGHPGLEISATCSAIDGRFQIHDYTADPVLGTLYSATISFEQVCDGMPGVIEGCVHYEAQATTPTSPPPPDPTMVSVQVLATTNDGTYDSTASAIFTDSTGAVVLDTQVDQYGEAEVALPGGGSLTTIQHVGGYEYIHSYRGLVTGDHVVVDHASANSGAEDLMVATFTPPVDANGASASSISVLTPCGGGGWSPGTGPLSAELPFYDGCRTSTFDMLTTVAFSDGQPQEFIWQTDLAHLANGNVEVDTGWLQMAWAIVKLVNVPASSPALDAAWSMLIGTTPVQMGSQRIDSPIAGNQEVAIPYPPGAGDGAVVTVDTFTSLLSSESRTVVESGAPSAVTVDFSTQPIPLVSAVQVDAAGASWTETPGGSADVRTVIWCGTLHTGDRVIWTLEEPYDGQPSTALPTLPAAHSAEDPTVDPDATQYGADVFYVDYDVVSGFTLAPPSGAYSSHSSAAQTYSMMFPF